MSHCHPNQPARAMTLLEMIVSMAIVSLLLGAVSSAVVIAGRAVEQQSPTSFNDTSPTIVLDRLLGEASLATAITEASATAITFSLPDRTGDLVDETVRYSWNGTVGDPLMRQFNAESAIAVSGGLARVDLTFANSLSSTSVPGLRDITTDVPLASFTGATSGSQIIDTTTSLCQYFRPQFADGTISWTITSIDLYARQAGSGPASGEMQIELVTPDPTGRPGSEVHYSFLASERDFSKSYSWTTFSIADAPTLAPGDSVCITVSDSAGKVSAEFALGLEDSSRSFASQGAPSTLTWTRLTAVSTPYRIRGTVVTQLPDTAVPSTLLATLSAELESASGAVARGTTIVFNRPELP